MMKSLVPLFSLIALALSAGPSRAGTVAASATPSANTAGTFSGASAVVGWEFMANADLTVTDLGYYDLRGNGLVESHEVGIWANGGALLGSAIVTSSDPLLAGFRYTAASPILLLAGQTYVIGGWTSTAEAYLTTVPFGSLASFSTAAEITYSGGRRAYDVPTLVRPDLMEPASNGRFGPNFQFVPTTGSVPDQAATLPLFGLAFAGLLAARGRSRKASDRVSAAAGRPPVSR